MTHTTRAQRQPDAAAFVSLQKSRTPRLWIAVLPNHISGSRDFLKAGYQLRVCLLGRHVDGKQVWIRKFVAQTLLVQIFAKFQRFGVSSPFSTLEANPNSPIPGFLDHPLNKESLAVFVRTAFNRISEGQVVGPERNRSALVLPPPFLPDEDVFDILSSLKRKDSTNAPMILSWHRLVSLSS